MSNVNEELDTLAAQWAAHCRASALSSNPKAYRNCDAFRQIVALGAPAVPAIMARFEKDTAVPWEDALAEITGYSANPDPAFIDGAKIRANRLKWWEQNKAKYVG
jgi:hypothetical protein